MVSFERLIKKLAGYFRIRYRRAGSPALSICPRTTITVQNDRNVLLFCLTLATPFEYFNNHNVADHQRNKMSSNSDIVRATLTRYPLLYIIISALALYVGIQQLKPSRRFPPGPKGFPFVGNALDFPKREQGRRFRDLSKQYGMFFSL